MAVSVLVPIVVAGLVLVLLVSFVRPDSRKTDWSDELYRMERESGSKAVDSYGRLYSYIKDDVILTFERTFLVLFEVYGMDYEGLPKADMNRITETFAADMAKVDRKCLCTYQWMHRQPVDFTLEGASQDAIYDELAKRRHEFITGSGIQFFSNRFYFGLEFPGMRASRQKSWRERLPEIGAGLVDAVKQRDWKSLWRAVLPEDELEVSLRQVKAYLDETVYPTCDSFESAFNYLRPRRLGFEEGYRTLHAIHNLDPVKRKYQSRPVFTCNLNYFLENSSVAAGPKRKNLIVDSKYVVDFMALRSVDPDALYHMLKDFEMLDFEFFLQSQWEPMSETKAESIIKLQRRAFKNTSALFSFSKEKKDDGIKEEWKEDEVVYMGEALKRIKSEGKYFGNFSLTVMYWAEDAKTLTLRREKLLKVFDRMKTPVIDEDDACFFQWWNMMPGHHLRFNYRTVLLTSDNYACYSMLYAIGTGCQWNDFYKSPAMCVLTTRAAMPYYFNVNESGSDQIHWAMLGKTGGGKSFLAKMLLLCARKTPGGQHYWIHTMGSDYIDLCRLLHGSYVRFNLNGPHALNLYCVKDQTDPAYVKVVLDVWRELFRAVQYEPRETEWNVFSDTVKRLFDQPVELRNNYTLMILLPEKIRKHVSHFVRGGAGRKCATGDYGLLFDGDSADPYVLTGRNPFTVYDYTELRNIRDLQRGIMRFLFYLQDRIIDDDAMLSIDKHCMIDEGAQIVGNSDSEINRYLREAANRWRKQRCALGFITQNMEDLKRLGLIDLIRNTCRQIIFLPNDGAEDKVYREEMPFLSEKDMDLIRTMVRKREFLLKSVAGPSKVLQLIVDPWTETLLSSDADVMKLKADMFEQYGFPESIDRVLEARRRWKIEADARVAEEARPRIRSILDAPGSYPAVIAPAVTEKEAPAALPVAAAASAASPGVVSGPVIDAESELVVQSHEIETAVPPAAVRVPRGLRALARQSA